MVKMIFTGHIMKVCGEIGQKKFEISKCLIIQIQSQLEMNPTSHCILSGQCLYASFRGRLLEVGVMLDDNDTQQYQIKS